MLRRNLALFASTGGVKKRAAFTQMSSSLKATAPVDARASNTLDFSDPDAPSMSATSSDRDSATGSSAQQAGQQMAAAAKQAAAGRLPGNVASMSDAEFDENVKVLQNIAAKSARSFAIFIGGFLTLFFVKRKKQAEQAAEDAKKEQEEKEKSGGGGGDDESAWKDLPAAEKYLREMRSQGWDLKQSYGHSGTSKEVPEMKPLSDDEKRTAEYDAAHADHGEKK